MQGVGFRPFVYKKAKEHAIYGFVKNVDGFVMISLCGSSRNVKMFVTEVIKNPPIQSRIEKIECTKLIDLNYKNFKIYNSTKAASELRFISPDIATCPNCIEEIMKKGNERFKYAFTNCTDCGPRYTIVKALPYDRTSTTMASFNMCLNCRYEYEDPQSRRFHAEPNCCSKCGPSLTLIKNNKQIIETSNPIEMTIDLLKKGNIIAIKGIGGFHLICDGKNEKSVELLRHRKMRMHKPLAVMVKDITMAKKYVVISKDEKEVLSSSKRPIVLLKKKQPFLLPSILAPNTQLLGLMLPYTPLHYMLFEDGIEILVMTSGNISGMPIQYRNDQAMEKLEKVADYFLMHDRDIYVPVDDAVVKIIQNHEVVVRLSRGYAPFSFSEDIKDGIVALGAEQKNTFCISKGGYIHMSQYLGDLKDFDSYINYQYVLQHLEKLLDFKPKIFAYDLHPAYLTTEYANRQNSRKIQVQHHHAHMVSCMVEHKLNSKVIGVIYDGTGLGADGKIWGGEFFVGNRSSYKRIAHFEYVTIQGYNQAVKEPWRCAESYLYFLGYNISNYLKDIDIEKLKAVEQALKNKINCSETSSIGRFFDCAAALIGVRSFTSYDAQAAIELENIIDEKEKGCYEYKIDFEDEGYLIRYKWIIEGILLDLKLKVAICEISAKFHNTLSKITCCMVNQIRENTGINDVVLSGGVFENQHLLNLVINCLGENNFNVFYNQKTPINDGGISFGQISIASAIIKEEEMKNVSCNSSGNNMH